jgi:iron complex transport system ATP-binding protein
MPVTTNSRDTFLEVKEVSFAYPGCNQVFEHISFTVRPGQTVSILGPNGAGKTTLLNCLANLEQPTSGEICLDGCPLRKLQPREVARKIGYIPQFIEPSFAFAVIDYVVTGCAPYMGTFEHPGNQHYEAAYEALRRLEIGHLAERSYMHVSGGERQQVAIARALCQRPAFILMDEPVAHLDCGNQIKVLRTIREMADEGYGILLTTHNPDHALLLGGNTAVLDRQGRLRFGPGEEILRQEILTELYGTELRLFYAEALSRAVCAAPKLQI